MKFNYNTITGLNYYSDKITTFDMRGIPKMDPISESIFTENLLNNGYVLLNYKDTDDIISSDDNAIFVKKIEIKSNISYEIL